MSKVSLFFRNLISGVYQFKVLWLLIMLYVLVIVMSNWFDSRIIQLHGSLVTDAGTLIFPITFLVSDLITEVYGYKFARKAIWFGFIFNFIFILFGIVVTHSASPDFALKTKFAIFSTDINYHKDSNYYK